MIAVEVLAVAVAALLMALVVGAVVGLWSERAPGTGARRPPTVSLLRLTGHKAPHQEMHLLINEQIVQWISDEAVRPEDYETQVDRLEELASRIAAALGVEVWLRRIDVSEQPQYAKRP